jgi:PAS domain-containing protein
MDKQNNPTGNKDTLAKTWQQRSTAFSDGVIIFITVILIYLLGYAFNLFDLFENWFEKVELKYFDELLLLLALGFAIYSVRRWLELKVEITERKRIEKSLRESEELFRQLAENIREVFFVRDLEQNQMIYVGLTQLSVI